jgi:molybdopterin synthase catalytic subunit
LQHEPFFPDQECLEILTRADADGGLLVYTRRCRQISAVDPLVSVKIEGYYAMVERQLTCAVKEARENWPLENVCLMQRVGLIAPDETILLLAVSASSRQAAFLASEYLLNIISTKILLWKKEYRTSGKSLWV